MFADNNIYVKLLHSLLKELLLLFSVGGGGFKSKINHKRNYSLPFS